MEYIYKNVVSIHCYTYNHSKYILDALNGFCMQKTNFPYVCIIVDDYSTDGEQEIIKKYYNEHFDVADANESQKQETEDYSFLFARHKINKNCFFAIYFLKYNHYKKKSKAPYFADFTNQSKYIAYCEGDDYWQNENKLQMQVEFLEKNPQYSMCFHGAKIKKEQQDLKVSIGCENIEKREYSADEVFANWIVPTASILHRKAIKIKKDKNFLHRDIIIILSCAEEGKLMGFSDTMSVYRIAPYGITQNKDLQSSHILLYPNHVEAIYKNFSVISKPIFQKILVRKLFQRATYYKNNFLVKKMIYDLIKSYKISIYYACRETLKYILRFVL